MDASMRADLKAQINEALNRAKWKKACYFYDDFGYRHFIGLFSQKGISEIKRLLREKKLLSRLSEFDVKTTEPDTSLNSNS